VDRTTGGEVFNILISQKCAAQTDQTCVETNDGGTVSNLPLTGTMTDNNDGTYEYEFTAEELGEVTVSVMITAETGGALAVDWYTGYSFSTFVAEGREVPNFNFGSGEVGLTGAIDNASAKFSGKICAPTSEAYTISTKADDTVLLTIDATEFA